MRAHHQMIILETIPSIGLVDQFCDWPLDTNHLLSYTMWRNKYQMNFDEEYIDKVVVNLKKKSFELYGSDGSYKTIDCEESQSFMDVLDVCRTFLDEELEYEKI